MATDTRSSKPVLGVPDALRAMIKGEGVSTGLFDDEIPPSEAAVNACVSQLEEVAKLFHSGEVFPLPHIEPGGDGDLRCEWNRGGRTVSITFSREGNGWLHVFAKRPDGVPIRTHHQLPDPGRLVKALRWEPAEGQ